MQRKVNHHCFHVVLSPRYYLSPRGITELVDKHKFYNVSVNIISLVSQFCSSKKLLAATYGQSGLGDAGGYDSPTVDLSTILHVQQADWTPIKSPLEIEQGLLLL